MAAFHNTKNEWELLTTCFSWQKVLFNRLNLVQLKSCNNLSFVSHVFKRGKFRTSLWKCNIAYFTIFYHQVTKGIHWLFLYKHWVFFFYKPSLVPVNVCMVVQAKMTIPLYQISHHFHDKPIRCSELVKFHTRPLFTCIKMAL